MAHPFMPKRALQGDFQQAFSELMDPLGTANGLAERRKYTLEAKLLLQKAGSQSWWRGLTLPNISLAGTQHSSMKHALRGSS